MLTDAIPMRRIVVASLAFALAAGLSCSRRAVSEEGAAPPEAQQAPNAPGAAPADPPDSFGAPAIFQKRILPIFQAQRPSSCTECHLSGVELKDYIRPTQEATFASLVAAGLVDVENVDRSKILEFIQRKPEKPSLVKDKIRQVEYEAFRAWLLAAVADPDLLTKRAAEPAGPQIPVEVIRHARTDRVMASFLDNIWTEVGRCAHCHSPDQNQKQVQEHGEQVSWIKLNDPLKTLAHMLEYGLIDPEDPKQSLLLLKPTLQVEHGGGQKMVVGDRTYKQFRRFLDDYAATVQGKYRSAGELPRPENEVSVVSEIWFKLTDVPEKYDQMLLQVDLYRATDRGWSEHRVATSDRPVFGKGKLWQHSLSLTAPRGSKEAEQLASGMLAPGRYLAKIYIDQTGKLAKDFQAELNEGDLVGVVEFESRWPTEYRAMTVVGFPTD
jgi:hypothetical protein